MILEYISVVYFTYFYANNFGKSLLCLAFEIDKKILYLDDVQFAVLECVFCFIDLVIKVILVYLTNVLVIFI